MLSRFSLFQLCVTLRTVASQASLSTEFLRQDYLSGLPCPPPGDLLTQVLKPLLMSLALAGRVFTANATWEARSIVTCIFRHSLLLLLLSRFSRV